MNLDHDVASMIRERFKGHEDVEALAFDYGISEHEVNEAIKYFEARTQPAVAVDVAPLRQGLGQLRRLIEHPRDVPASWPA